MQILYAWTAFSCMNYMFTHCTYITAFVLSALFALWWRSLISNFASPIFRREHFLIKRSEIVGLKIFHANSQVSIILIAYILLKYLPNKSFSVATSVGNHDRSSVGASDAILPIIIGCWIFMFGMHVQVCFPASQITWDLRVRLHSVSYPMIDYEAGQAMIWIGCHFHTVNRCYPLIVSPLKTMHLILYGWQPFNLQCQSTGDIISLDTLATVANILLWKEVINTMKDLFSIENWSVLSYNRTDDNTNWQ